MAVDHVYMFIPMLHALNQLEVKCKHRMCKSFLDLWLNTSVFYTNYKDPGIYRQMSTKYLKKECN